MSNTTPDHEWELLRAIAPALDYHKAPVLDPDHREDLFLSIVANEHRPRWGVARVVWLARTGHRRRRWAAVGASGTVLGGGIVAALVLLSSTAAPAFAGWSADPTSATPAALAAATADCNFKWDRSSPDDMTTADAVLSETRGAYTAAIFVTSSNVYDCISNGGNGTTVGSGGGALGQTANGTVPSPAPDQISSPFGGGGSAPGFPGGNPNEPLPQRWQRRLSNMSNPTQRARQEQDFRKALSQGVASFTYGRAGSDVSAVTLTIAGGLTVDATVQNGWYFAWWPTLDSPTAVQVTTNSGSTATTTLGPLG